MTQQLDDDPQRLLDETRQQLEQTQQQVLRYGRDMAEIYIQEKEKREALEVANRKLAAALDGMSDGFLVIDAGLHIEQINLAGAQMLEFSEGSAIGQSLADVLAGDSVHNFIDQLLHSQAAKVQQRVRLTQPVPRILSVEAARLPGDSWGVVLHDVTWEERLSNMRNEFLNIAAHELRTPLAGLIGFTSLLEQLAEERGLDSDTRRMVNNILLSSERLRNAVDDLINFASSSQSAFSPEPMPLETALQEVVSAAQEPASKQGVAVLLTLPEQPLEVRGDRQMLLTAFQNLVENGIFFNQPGGTVHVEAKVLDDRYVISVQDTGIGISQVDLKYVYEPFFQVEEHTTRRTEGLGLGLSITRKIILLHNGQISIESKLNEGTTVEVVLPRHTREATEPPEVSWLSTELERSRQELDRYRVGEARARDIIQQLEEQLQSTQAQNLAYAQDLADLYRRQRDRDKQLKQQAASLSHSDRLILMGQMAASVAHDISNLVTPILGYSQLILRRKETIEPDLVDIAERILNASRRANILLRQMVTLAGTRSERREPADLSDLVEDTVHFLEVRFRHASIEVNEDYSDTPLPIYCSQIQISQVLLNLMVNAIDAMPEGGSLRLQTGASRHNDVDWAEARITDSGTGIPTENLARIFEPFFTTKPESVGTGLGLAVSKEIIDNHQGQIFAESEVGVGTTFVIRLALSKQDENE
ncbi:MAG: ATP-binding protein [Anaerolineae bacterium]